MRTVKFDDTIAMLKHPQRCGTQNKPKLLELAMEAFKGKFQTTSCLCTGKMLGRRSTPAGENGPGCRNVKRSQTPAVNVIQSLMGNDHSYIKKNC